MAGDSTLGWADLQEMTSELIGDNRPGTANWKPESAVTTRTNESFIQQFRQNNGKIPGELEDVPFLIITTIGAKSGKERLVPLAYHDFDGRILIIASMGGAKNNPPWYYNLIANPDVVVEKGGETYDATAVMTEGDDREACFKSVCDAMPVFSEYQARAGRTIPVFELKRK